MRYISADLCIACGACESNCPPMAIYFNGSTYVINQADCIDCRRCEYECPVNAISVS